MGSKYCQVQYKSLYGRQNLTTYSSSSGWVGCTWVRRPCSDHTTWVLKYVCGHVPSAPCCCWHGTNTYQGLAQPPARTRSPILFLFLFMQHAAPRWPGGVAALRTFSFGALGPMMPVTTRDLQIMTGWLSFGLPQVLSLLPKITRLEQPPTTTRQRDDLVCRQVTCCGSWWLVVRSTPWFSSTSSMGPKAKYWLVKSTSSQSTMDRLTDLLGDGCSAVSFSGCHVPCAMVWHGMVWYGWTSNLPWALTPCWKYSDGQAPGPSRTLQIFLGHNMYYLSGFLGGGGLSVLVDPRPLHNLQPSSPPATLLYEFSSLNTACA